MTNDEINVKADAFRPAIKPFRGLGIGMKVTPNLQRGVFYREINCLTSRLLSVKIERAGVAIVREGDVLPLVQRERIDVRSSESNFSPDLHGFGQGSR
jgi:hypothetical protein